MKTSILAILIAPVVLLLAACSSVDAQKGRWYSNADNLDTSMDFYPSGKMKHFQQGSNLHSPIIHGYDKLISHTITAAGAAGLALSGGGAAPVAEKVAGAGVLLGHAAVTNSAPPATPAPRPAALQAH